jgi:hypothetical protein
MAKLRSIPMVSNLLAEVRKQERKIAIREAKLLHERALALSGLPGMYGFDSAAAFLKAVRAAVGPASKKRTGKAKSGKRRRAKITPKIKEGVAAAVKEGKTGSEIAKKFGISLPSVHNIKKAAGLVKNR